MRMNGRGITILLIVATVAVALVFIESRSSNTREVGAEVHTENDIAILKECMKDAHFIWGGEMAKDDPSAILTLAVILFERRVREDSTSGR